MMSLPKFIKATGIYYPRELETFKRKKGTYLQPIFEAVTNAWEAIMDKFGSDNLNQGKITITLNVSKGLDLENNSVYQIQTIQIADNGIGLDEENLTRLQNLRDPSKKPLKQRHRPCPVLLLFWLNCFGERIKLW